MKITNKSNTPSVPAWLNNTFTFELTGTEVLRLWSLSYECEGGPKHPDAGIGNRFHEVVETFLREPRAILETHACKLNKGLFRND